MLAKELIRYQVLLTFLIIGTFIPLESTCQQILPTRIEVQYYRGGDYRDRDIRGVGEDTYDLTLTYDEKFKIYRTKQLKYKHQVFDFDRRKFSDYRLVEDSTIVIYDEFEVDTLMVLDLIKYTTLEAYSEMELIDTFTIGDSDNSFINIDTALVLKGLSIEDIGIDTTFFHEACELYRKVIISRDWRNEDNLPECFKEKKFDELQLQFIKEANAFRIVSSYSTWVYVRLVFDNGDEKEITQRYPGRYNTGWNIVSNNRTYRVVNPRLNRLVSKFMHNRYSPIETLREFEELELLVDLYLTTQ